MVLKKDKSNNFCSVTKHDKVTFCNSSTDNFNKKSVLRIIDANLNRCREGLRVVEDGLRFVLNDKLLYEKVRNIRHNVDKILRSKYKELIKERNSVDDAGRQIPEVSKKELQEIIIANLKRSQESLRVLEEYSKVFIPEMSAEFKKQRYEVYALEKILFKMQNFIDTK
jgi:thiamine-phosphate pyrophosphorylase